MTDFILIVSAIIGLVSGGTIYQMITGPAKPFSANELGAMASALVGMIIAITIVSNFI